MNWTKPALIIVTALAALAAAADDTGKSDRLDVPGVVSIAAPVEGYTWRPLAVYDPNRGGQYLCEPAKGGGGGRVIVGIDPRHITTNPARVATLKAHWNALVQSLTKSGYTNLKGRQPKFEPPMPDDVAFSMVGNTPSGEVRYFAFHTVFANHTYLIQAVAASEEEAQTFGGVARKLKEPGETRSH